MLTTILTANYDGYDVIKPIMQQSIDVEWICVTDNPYLPNPYRGWRVVYEPRPHLHPNRAAKTPKMLPWLYTGTKTSIWIDASYVVISRNFAEEVLNYAQPIAQFEHPWRNCAYEELEESLLLEKYTDVKPQLQAQYDRLREHNHPSGWGLWATGVIARQHTPAVINMGFDWLNEIYSYSYQDQVSHPLVCKWNGLRPIDLPGTHLANEWLAYEGSGRHL